LNSNSHLIIDEKFEEKRIGNQTECALLDFVNKQLIKLDRQEKTYESIKSNSKILKMYPFNSTTKKMTIVVEVEHESSVRIFTKGASENIIEDCNRVINNGNGEIVELEGSGKSHLKDTVIRNMAMNALRTIAFGYKDMPYD
jgi:magnesium-transporting ATPase (P-type)